MDIVSLQCIYTYEDTVDIDLFALKWSATTVPIPSLLNFNTVLENKS